MGKKNFQECTHTGDARQTAAFCEEVFDPWTGELVPNIGSGLTAFDLRVYYAYQQIGMTTATVQVSLTEFLSIVLQGSAAGVWTARYDPPKLMLLGDRGRRWACITSALRRAQGFPHCWNLLPVRRFQT